MSEHPKTTDPVEAVLSWLSQRKTRPNLKEVFYGPADAFALAVGSPRGPTDIVPKLGEITAKLQNGWREYYPDLEPRWHLLQQLARLRAGATFDVQEILKELDLLCPYGPTVCEPFPAEEELLRELVDAYFQPGDGGRRPVAWRPSHWRLLDFLAESRGMPLASDKDREQTPVLLANYNVGRTYALVVERSFGPPGLISPDWWKLGLIPLGHQESFRHAVHRGFQAVLGHHPLKRLRLRWWLEEQSEGEDWFDELGDGRKDESENRSVEVAAACAARALLDTDAPPELRPLLDDSVAVSATLEPAGPETDRRKLPDALTLGEIDYADKKRDAALRAGLSGVVFAPKQDVPEGVHGDPEKHIVVVQKVANFGDAYDSLLVTSKAVAQHLAGVAARWDAEWDERPTPEEYRRDQSRESE